MIEDPYGPVIEIGSHHTKCGFSGDDAPRTVFPTIVGRPKDPKYAAKMASRFKCFVGDEAFAKRDILNLNFPVPVDNKSTTDWVDVERVLFHCPWNEVKYTPCTYPLVMVGFHYMEEKSFEILAEILLGDREYFGYRGLVFCDASVCSVYSLGKSSGLSVDLGHGHSEVTAVYEGLPIHHSKIVLEDRTAEKRTRLGGKLITDTMSSILSSNGKFKACALHELEIVRDMKEKLCYFELEDKVRSFRSDEKYSREERFYSHEYELPDGSNVNIGRERFLAPEILFNPSLIGYNLPGIHELIEKSIYICDEELQDVLYHNICLCGGTSQIEGIGERLRMELEPIIPSSKRRILKIHNDQKLGYGKFSTWCGASIFGSLRGACLMFTTKEDYQEYGYSLVERMSPYCSRKNKDQHRLILSLISSLTPDVDLKERIEYIFFKDDSTDDGFKICILGMTTVISIRFKSLLLN